MNGVHDCGGMEGMGPIVVDPQEPVFHADWERRVFALLWAAGFNGFWNLDEFRHCIERMSADEYLGTSYYEHWLHGLETLLIEKNVLTATELFDSRGRDPIIPENPAAPMTSVVVPAMISQGASAKKLAELPTAFAVGAEVRAKNINPHGHTRLPRYARGKRGTVERDHGVFPFNDSNAHGSESPQHVYLIRFSAKEIWGDGAPDNDSLYLDLWESHLQIHV